MQGIWTTGQDGSDINACDFTKENVKDLGYQIVATGDDNGDVKIFRWPSTVDDSMSVVGKGHSSNVMGIRLTPDGSRMFSVGGND